MEIITKELIEEFGGFAMELKDITEQRRLLWKRNLRPFTVKSRKSWPK